MKAKYCKEKGRKAELEVAKIFRDTGIDTDCKRQPLSGGSFLKGDLNTRIGYCPEIKFQETAKIWEWIEQAEQQAKKQGQPALLIFRRSKSQFYCCMNLFDWIELYKSSEMNTSLPHWEIEKIKAIMPILKKIIQRNR